MESNKESNNKLKTLTTTITVATNCEEEIVKNDSRLKESQKIKSVHESSAGCNKRFDNNKSRKQPAKKRARKTSDRSDVTTRKYFLL